MKSSALLIAALLLCGCNSKTQWEYKTITVGDQKKWMDSHALEKFVAKQITQEQLSETLASSKPSAGNFGSLDSGELVQMGNDGWEQVDTFLEPRADGRLVMIFKRPK